MTAPWRKALADVWHERTRTALVVLAIAVGVASFLAVLATYTILKRELNRGYLATTPASAVLTVTGVDDDTIAAVKARDDVADADARRLVTGRILTGPARWRRIVFFVLRDFRDLRINTIAHEAGAWPPATGEMLIERDAFQVARAAIGDSVTVELHEGQPHTLRVAGRVHDPGQAQARMEDMVYAYVTRDTMAALGNAAPLDRLQILVEGDRFDYAHVRAVATQVRTWLDARGTTVSRLNVPRPGQHPHAVIMGVLLLAIAAFGLFALALSGMIVVNLLLATMTRQRRQIGVMKAIGGSRTQIADIYLTQAAVIGGAAFAVAVPFGLLGARLLSGYLAVLLNFDLASLAVPPWVFALAALVAVLVPLAAAAYPVMSGTAISVRAALAPEGANPETFGSSRSDRLLCGIGTAGRPLLLGVRNLARRRTRTALTLVVLTIAGAFFIAGLSTRSSIVAAVDRAFAAGQFPESARYAVDQHMLMIYAFLLIVSAVLGVVGGLGLMTSMSLNVLDRRRELGVLRAIGGTPRTVAGIVVVEAIAVAVMSWLLAVALAWPIVYGLGRLLTVALLRGGAVIDLAGVAVFGWLAIVVLLSLLASVSPAASVSRRSVQEAISYE